MALIESIQIPLGAVMPEFSLPDPNGKIHPYKSLFGPKGLLVVFTCNHCPYAIAVWPRLIRYAREFARLGIGTVAVNPNIHPSYPEDAPGPMKTKIAEWGIPFPYLVDLEQKTAKDYKAQCTPDLYLLNSDSRLVYHGRIDDNWKDEAAVSQRELEEAVRAHAEGRPVSLDQKPSMGCSIKWK